MSNPLQTAMHSIRALWSPGQASELGPLNTNAHVHLPPNFSAFDTVKDALDIAAREGIAVLGACNYYDYTAYASLVEGALAKGIVPVLGTEILSWMDDQAQLGARVNDPGNPGKVYIVGKSMAKLDAPTPWAQEQLNGVRERDSARMANMVAKLEGVFTAAGFQTGLDAPTVAQRVAKRHGVPVETVVLQERHVAQAFQERLFELVPEAERIEALTKLFGVGPKSTEPVAVQGELRSHLMKAGKPAYVEERFLGFADARRLILELGGMPCYPVLADGANPVAEFEADPDLLADSLLERGIFVAEFIPNRNDPTLLNRYVTRMRTRGLVVMAGTEHNTLDRIPLLPSCLKGAPVPDAAASVFWEGACVAVGHQAAVLAGLEGYVTPDGSLNPAYESGDSRIAEYAAIGRSTIARARSEYLH